MTPDVAVHDAAASERRRAPPAGGDRAPTAADPLGPPAEGVAPALWEALRDSALRVQAEWQQLAEHAAGPEEVAQQLAVVCTALRQVLGADEPADGAPLPRTALARRTVGLLRTTFLERARALAPAPDSQQLLDLLLAIDQVSQRLEVDWSKHFADRLSGPDGLELVVEVAHDLRSPLTSILFLAETLQRQRSGPVNPVQERQLGLIYSAAFGLSSVASDVIELARGGDRLVDLDPIPFSTTDILESVRDIVQPIAEEKSLTVRLVPPDVDFRVGHPVALSRVLLNLTTNALKFTAEGFVEVATRPLNDRELEFSVRDTGKGIPEHSMVTLFEPFRRRQKPGEYAFSGSGLGLSICRKLVEAMGSTLQVETAAGWGTRFCFVLDLPPAGDLMTPG